ncbi:hypothetical protein JYU34_008236 [Plutella xylostella]|uniref:Uncharacterized protein n=1 Tax=Plutella xylostella TaxID=51655 RepID=A0ABQ7QP46_PLUXY|nr:hypothetical protein JYU34_008236 [Plutella xylostella]
MRKHGVKQRDVSECQWGALRARARPPPVPSLQAAPATHRPRCRHALLHPHTSDSTYTNHLSCNSDIGADGRFLAAPSVAVTCDSLLSDPAAQGQRPVVHRDA